MKETISIIVPVYNAERTLRRCVQSLTGQTYGNIEILLVNDGSRDGSLALCREFEKEDSRIRVIDKPNGGVSSARNAGLDAARGEFVMFCDSDDWVSPAFCETMLRNAAAQDLTVCSIAGNGPGDEPQTEAPAKLVRSGDFLKYPAVMSAPWNKLYHTEVINKHGLRFSEQLRLGEDFVFVLEYLGCLKGQVRLLEQKLYYYDLSTEGSLSKRSVPMEQCDLFYRRITAAMEKLGAMDAESIMNRDLHVMSQLENMMIAIAQDSSMTFGQKMQLAKQVGKLESFRNTNSRAITWENPFFTWLLDKKYARLSMTYLILRAWKGRKFAAGR